MTQELSKIIPTDFNEDSKVWIFQSNRPFNEQEELEINEQLLNFYSQWNSHGKEIKGWAKLLFKRIVVVLADETSSEVSGCSTDSMIRIIKSFERQYQVDFFNRTNILFMVKNQAEALPMNQVKYALENGFLETDTPLFNNLVDSKKTLLNEWLVPLNKSWLWNRIVN